MGILRNIVIGVFAISFLTFVALFGQLPALRRTPISWLHKALCLHLPNNLKRLDRYTTGGRITTERQTSEPVFVVQQESCGLGIFFLKFDHDVTRRLTPP